MKFPLSRRQALLGGAAVGAVALGGGVYAATAGPHEFFGAMLRANLPGARISDETVRAFTEDAMLGRNADFAPKLRVLAGASRIVGFNGLDAAMGSDFDFEKFNREFLTRFLVGSNYLELADPTSEEVAYFGAPRSCSNPFAQFDAPAEPA